MAFDGYQFHLLQPSFLNALKTVRLKKSTQIG
jgi:hypothetical protein